MSTDPRHEPRLLQRERLGNRHRDDFGERNLLPLGILKLTIREHLSFLRMR